MTVLIIHSLFIIYQAKNDIYWMQLLKQKKFAAFLCFISFQIKYVCAVDCWSNK